MNNTNTPLAIITALVLLFGAPAVGQWLNSPTAGVPRLRDGKPNLTAPAPRTADGKPDFSGVWEAEQGPVTADVAGGARIAPEFIDIAARLTGGLPYSPVGIGRPTRTRSQPREG